MLIWSELKNTSCSPDLKANSKSCLTNFLTNELELIIAFVEQDNFHDDPHADLVRIKKFKQFTRSNNEFQNPFCDFFFNQSRGCKNS